MKTENLKLPLTYYDNISSFNHLKTYYTGIYYIKLSHPIQQ